MRYRRLLGLALGVAAFTTLFGSVFLRRAQATPTLRYQTDFRGDLLVIGNTLGFDCRAGIADPVVGSVNRTQCFANPAFSGSMYIDDSSADVFFRCEDNGQVSSNASIQIAQARSAAFLKLPAGATVAYARIYWGSTVYEDTSTSSSILIDRPGAFAQNVAALSGDLQAADRSFQASADITALVQTQGEGVYRVSGAGGFPKTGIVDHPPDDNNYAAWAMVVLYKRDTDPVRTLSVYDGLSFISPLSSSNLSLRGFVVPAQGAGDSKLALIGYEGDHDQFGDTIKFNNIALTDGQPGSDSNLLNSSRTAYGQPSTMPGDLPQLTGTAGSMSGLDLDVISLTPLLNAGDTQGQLDIVTGTAVNADRFFVGALATAITSRKPVIEAVLTVPANISPLPGDTVEYTLSVRNVGDDTATGLFVEQVLPLGLSFVPGSVSVLSGPNQGTKTDRAGDDEVEYDSANRTLRIRLGTGANATKGGDLPSGPSSLPILVSYQLQIGDLAYGGIAAQAMATATPASQPSVGPTLYPSGDGIMPNRPTVITVRECASNFDCTVTAPVCDMRQSPHRCTASCIGDGDCMNSPGGQDVCGTSQLCAQCSPQQHAACTPDGQGATCLPNGTCGCQSDADCGGRSCNLVNNSCPQPSADLSLQLTTSPDPADVDHPIELTLAILNKGPELAPSGAQLQIQIPSGGNLQSVQAMQGWRCTQLKNAARCTYYRPIKAGDTSPNIKLVIAPATEDSQSMANLTMQATLSSTSSSDPAPNDNTISKTIEIGRYRVAGGGLGCSLTNGGRLTSLWSAAAVALFLLLSFRRRRSLRQGTTPAGHA